MRKYHTRLQKTLFFFVGFIMFFAVLPQVLVYGASSPAKGKKILVVMSYHEGYVWQDQVVEGINTILKEARLKYFHLDTKRNKAGGEAKAKEAYALYQEFKPDAVIAVDDNAQSMFVVPYLKNKVKTPVIFCGVNFDAAEYVYPASNVTGVLERFHWKEGLNFLKLIVPSVETGAVIYNTTPSNDKIISYMKKEMSMYPVKITKFITAKHIGDLTSAIKEIKPKVDVLLFLTLEGTLSENNTPMTTAEATRTITDIWDKATLGQSTWQLKDGGVLCAIAKAGQEQGYIASQMVLDLFSGKIIGDIPISENRNGRRMLNMSTANKLGIELKPSFTTGTELIFSD